jgi:List-Bact-rpt repeat protein
MRATRITRFVLSTWKQSVCILLAGMAVFLVTKKPLAQPPADPELKVLRTGLGGGTVTSDASHPGINCGGGGDCSHGYLTTDTVELTATPDGTSTFAGWEGDCTTTPCVLAMGSERRVRAKFNLSATINTISDFTPTGPTGTAGLKQYLIDNPNVDSAARFVAALPTPFRQNWILMTRSESLQTGTAVSPRILMSSEDARAVFTVGMTRHSSYPGADPRAIEYMQWDPVQKNFRFHEIVLATIPQVFAALPDGSISTIVTIPERHRGISIDDAKCPKCHSTRNVPNLVDHTVDPPTRGSFAGTDGIPAGSVKSKNKPNWDPYDSWGGAMPFNRDRIYQGSVEAAAFRALLNPWTYETDPAVRAVLEQLEPQPPGVPAGDLITRTVGGPNDGHINFPFDASPPVLIEPSPSPTASPSPDPAVTPNYSFNHLPGTGVGSNVVRGGSHVTLHHSVTPTNEEGRAVQFFDLLGGADGSLNQLRIGNELASQRFATGSIPLDARPVALAIAKGCYTRDITANDVLPRLAGGVAFFSSRHGLPAGQGINEIFANTRERTRTVPRRKADIEKFNLDRTLDPYLDVTADQTGLIQRYGASTAQGTPTNVERIRQDVFRRPIDTPSPDTSEIGGFYVDREEYSVNTEQLALFRYFLEPLGVSVDKWSMGVRGRSRNYAFADVFTLGAYLPNMISELETSLNTPGDHYPTLPGAPPYSCTDLRAAVENSFLALPPATGAGAMPKYTDVQRIFNKSCIECHGGLAYPPFNRFDDVTYLDLSENEDPAAGNRLDRPHTFAVNFGTVTTTRTNSRIYRLITRTNEDCSDTGIGMFGMMPCGGPKLNSADIETIGRWIEGGSVNTWGDPHLTTIDGTHYDFQSAGEFVLLRGENLEIQARQTPVETVAPLAPNDHTGLSSCVSINTAAAFRVGPHRITYQPNPGSKDGSLQLHIDGKSVEKLGDRGLVLDSGGRILPTTAPGGIQIEYPGGTDIVVTPSFWSDYQVWYLTIDVRHARASEGVMGAIAPGNWLPALPDGTFLGTRPNDLHQRYVDLYEKFADAWRVNDGSSLFEYEPGFSTSRFTIKPWPAEVLPQSAAPQACQLPRGAGPALRPTLKQLAPEVAKQSCAAIVDPRRRGDCELDVMATGEVSFAENYLQAEKIQLNKLPTAPTLLSPEDDKIGADGKVTFTWEKAADAEGNRLNYMHCVWPTNQRHTFNQCVDMPTQMGMLGGLSKCGLLLLVLIICLVIVIVLFIKARKGRLLLALLAIVVVIAILFVIYYCRGSSTSRTVQLQPGKAYFWKVIVEDGKGGTVESETRRVIIK